MLDSPPPGRRVEARASGAAVYTRGPSQPAPASLSRRGRTAQAYGDPVTNEFTLTETGTEPTALAFADADGCLRWLHAQALSSVPKHYGAVLGQLKRLSDADFAPRERATIAEVLREQVAYLHTELARRYAGKPQPAADRELEAAEQAIALWQALWEQYSACLKPLLEGDPELQGVKAKLLQRGLYVGKQLVLVHGLARRVPPPTLWQELHAYYRLAEMLECAVTAVSDELTPQRGRHLVLLDLLPRAAAGPRRPLRDVGQADRADRPLAVDVGAQGLPVRAAARDRGPGDRRSTSTRPPARRSCRSRRAHARDVDALRLSGQARDQRPRAAEAARRPAPIPRSCSSATTRASKRARRCCRISTRTGTSCRAQRRTRRRPALDLCVGGLGAAYFRVGGRTFDRQDPLGRLSFQGAQHLQTLGALTDYDRDKEDAERTGRGSAGSGGYEWREATVRRVGGGSYRWHLEQLVDRARRRARALRLRDARRAGRPTASSRSSLRLWPGTPQALAVRPMSTALCRGAADAGAAAGRDARGQGRLIVAAAHVQPGPGAALDGRGAGAPIPADAARCSAARTSSASPSRSPDQAASRAGPPRGRTMTNRLAGDDQPVPAAARRQPGRLVSVGRRGARARARARTSRSCCRSAIRRATGAT